jgi:hypothetical protein
MLLGVERLVDRVVDQVVDQRFVRRHGGPRVVVRVPSPG